MGQAYTKPLRAISCATLIAAVVFFESIAQGAAQPAVDNYANLPSAELAEISPNGRIIAMVQPAGDDNRMIAFYPLDGSTPSRVDIGPMKARDLTWVSDDRVLLLISTTRSIHFSRIYTWEFFRFLTIDYKTGENHFLFGSDNRFDYHIGTLNLLHTLPADPNHILVETGNPTRGYALSAYLVDLKSDRHVVVDNGEPESAYYVVDAEGELRVRVDYVDKWDRIEINYRDKGEKRFKKVAEYAHEDGKDPKYLVVALTEEGDAAVATAYSDDGRLRLIKLSLTGEPGETVWSHPVYDLGEVIVDEYSRAAIGVEFTADFPQQAYFSESEAVLHDRLKRSLRQYSSVRIESRSADGERRLVRAAKPGAPGDLFLLDHKRMELSFVASNYPNIIAEELGEVERYDYRTSDGLDVPGYLYRPSNGLKSSLPLVVLPHGGPRWRDTMEFDWEAQYYAALGFAVYKPNFRGSTGYGRVFRNAGNREWAGKMQSDITEGVEKLIVDGIADPTRICIVGSSYGGYAALVGGALTPDLYKCVIAFAPVTDIPGLFKFEERYSGRYSDFLKNLQETIGDDWNDKDKMKEISPVNMANRFKAPVLLIHGKDDTVVPIEQSDDMESALKAAGKEVDYVVLKGEDHWLSTASTRKAMLEASGAFLIKHLGQ